MSKRGSSPKKSKITPDFNRRTFFETVERLSLWTAMIAALVTAVLTLILGAGEEGLRMVGARDSAAARGLISTVIICLVVGPLAYTRGMRARNRLLPAEFRRDYRISAIPMTLAATLLVAVIVAWSFELFNRSFQGIQFSTAGLTIFLALLSGVVAYGVTTGMSKLRTQGMLYLVVASLFGTLLFAGATNDDPYWWEYSFSHLGMTASDSKAIFNFGLLFTGALIVIWQQFFIKEFAALERRGLVTHRTVQLIRTGLIASGIMLAMVGVVRFGIGLFFNIIHDLSAGGVGVILGLMMLTMWKLNPHYVKEFYYMSGVILAGMIFAAAAKVLGFIGLTALEMAAFALASLWLILFLRNTELLLEHVAPETRL